MSSQTESQTAKLSGRVLADSLSNLDVSNVFIYVGDAVRDGSLPPRITDQGTYIRTVAASTNSPTSFSSLVTGCYPPTHGVTTFEEQVPSDVDGLFDIPGSNGRFLNSIFAYATEDHGRAIDPIYAVLDMEPPSVDSPFEGLETPFVAMERGPGGHAPYGDFTGTAVEYFMTRGGERERIRSEYERSIELDIDWFDRRLEELDRRGLREDTLVIYTSDHGELLGEGGILGHNGPMRPELVYVPTVFYHPDIPNGTVTDSTFHHVDLLPTVRAALGKENNQEEVDGRAPTEGIDDDPRPCFWRNGFLPDRIPLLSGELSYEGVWDSSGGRVYTDISRLERYSVLVGKLIRSSKRNYMYRHPCACMRSYWWNQRRFGEPGFDGEVAREILRRTKETGRTSEAIDLSDEEREHLRDLGYLN